MPQTRSDRPQRRSGALGLAYVACTLGAAVALLLAGHSLWEAVATSGDVEPVAEIRTASARLDPGREENGPGSAPIPSWPALFGAPAEAPPVAAPPTEMPVSYVLKGLVTTGEMRWAILSGDGEDQLIREGDELTGGVAVESILPEGVWLRLDDRRELIAFSDTAPVRTASVELEPGDGDTGSQPRRQEVQTQSLTPTQLRDLILKAEADRIAKGLVPPKPESPQDEAAQ